MSEGSALGIVSIFRSDFIENHLIIVLLIFVLIFIIFHVVEYIRANNLKKITLRIRDSNFIIKEGDIFEEKGLKVINFNEYFDTIVNNKIIAFFEW